MKSLTPRKLQSSFGKGDRLGLGSADGIDHEHLARVKRAVGRFEPALVSEHLAWSTHGATFLNDLLPLPYTPATLSTVCDHVDEMQAAILLEIALRAPLGAHLLLPLRHGYLGSVASSSTPG